MLYVGKAKSLKNRVGQYAQGRGHTNAIYRMIHQTVSMEVIVTATETEALLLETNMIKRLRPRYNVLMRDDKSFPFIAIRTDHATPVLQKHRGAKSFKGKFYGPFASAGAVTPEFDLFIKEVRPEMTAKCGQKCTAIRRIIVPENVVEEVQIALGKALAQTTLGDPRAEGVRMGALVSKAQGAVLRQRVAELLKASRIVYGNLDHFEPIGASKEKGAFLPPVLLLNDAPFKQQESHHIEAFGPVATLMPYRSLEEAIELANLGKGSLVSTICTHSKPSPAIT